MKITLNIQENDFDKAKPLLDYLKSIDFISIEAEEVLNVPDWHKEIVLERLKNPVYLEWNSLKENFDNI